MELFIGGVALGTLDSHEKAPSNIPTYSKTYECQKKSAQMAPGFGVMLTQSLGTGHFWMGPRGLQWL